MRFNDDPTRLRNRVMREALGYVAHGVMFPFGYIPSGRPRRPRDSDDDNDGESDIDTVVFVHGIAANRACFFPMQAWLARAGLTRHVSFNYATLGSIEQMAMRLRDDVAAHVRSGRVHIVAHSLGGLVARTYIQALGGDQRVSTCVTLGTPHQGTRTSAYSRTPVLQQLRPGGSFVQFIESLPAPRTRFVSMGALNDHLIVPSSSSHAPFGERVPLFADVGHTTLLLSPTVMRAVTGALPHAHAHAHAHATVAGRVHL